ncbi:hypothetical protein ACOJBO_07835 [Rhizobium beringeri]
MRQYRSHLVCRYRIQEAELDYLTHSRAAETVLAENYVGLLLSGRDCVRTSWVASGSSLFSAN